ALFWLPLHQHLLAHAIVVERRRRSARDAGVDAQDLITVVSLNRLSDATRFHILQYSSQILAQARNVKLTDVALILRRGALPFLFTLRIGCGKCAEVSTGAGLCNQFEGSVLDCRFVFVSRDEIDLGKLHSLGFAKLVRMGLIIFL